MTRTCVKLNISQTPSFTSEKLLKVCPAILGPEPKAVSPCQCDVTLKARHPRSSYSAAVAQLCCFQIHTSKAMYQHGLALTHGITKQQNKFSPPLYSQLVK